MNRPTRVVHVLGSVDRGGAEMRTLEIVRQLDPALFKVGVVTLSGRYGELSDEYRAAGAEIHPLPIRDFRFPAKFHQFLREWRADVVHSHVALSSGPILLLAATAGVRRRIAHLRSDGVDLNTFTVLKKSRLYISRELMWRLATRVLAVSPSALDNAAAGTNRGSKAEVLPNGIDLSKFNPSKVGDIRAELVPGLSEPLIVHVGRADIPTKNREGALEYFRAHRLQGGLGHLLFVGRDCASGEDPELARAAWRQAAQQLGLGQHVTFLGERSDVPSIIASSDVFLSTSTLEGLPGVVLEARALGTPTVSSAVPGAVFLAERLGHIKIVRSNEQDSWAAAIWQALATQPSMADRQAAHDSLVGSEFDVSVTAKRLERLWRGEEES